MRPMTRPATASSYSIPKRATLRVLDSAALDYSGLAWRKDSADLAFLRSKGDDKHYGAITLAMAWRHLGEATAAAYQYDPFGRCEISSRHAHCPLSQTYLVRRRPDRLSGYGEMARETTRRKKPLEKEAATDADEPVRSGCLALARSRRHAQAEDQRAQRFATQPARRLASRVGLAHSNSAAPSLSRLLPFSTRTSLGWPIGKLTHWTAPSGVRRQTSILSI